MSFTNANAFVNATAFANATAFVHADPYGTTSYAPHSTLADFFTGILMTLIISGPFWYGLRKNLMYYALQNESLQNDESVEDSEEEDSEEGEDYSMNYMTEYELLADRPLISEDILALQEKSVKETTDFGDIIMIYNGKTETFWYYTDQLREVSYTLLEAIARKFVVEHNCKRLYLGGRSTVYKDNTTPVGKTEQDTETVKGSCNPFAKFKQYNNGKGANANFSTGVNVVEQTNHFRYKGKLYDYEDALKTTEKKMNEVPTMTYAAFKELVESAKKQN